MKAIRRWRSARNRDVTSLKPSAIIFSPFCSGARRDLTSISDFGARLDGQSEEVVRLAAGCDSSSDGRLWVREGPTRGHWTWVIPNLPKACGGLNSFALFP